MAQRLSTLATLQAPPVSSMAHTFKWPLILRVLSGMALLLLGAPLQAQVVASVNASLITPALPEKPAAKEPDGTESEPDFEEPPMESYFKEGFGLFEESRDDLSKKLFHLGLGVDRYLAGRGELDDPNETYARVRLAETWLEGEGLVNDTELKFHLDLPSTKRRYRLIFENDTEDQGTLRNRSNPTGLTNANLDREGMSAAVRLAIRDMENWQSDFDIGIRGSIPLDPFVRHNLKRQWELGSDWNFRMRQRAGYFDSKGYIYNMLWGFDRLLDPDLAFRANTEMDWNQRDDKLRFGEALGVTKQLNDRQLLDYAFGIVGQSLSVGFIDEYYVAITHRTLLHEDWLILDLVPEVRYPREREFNETLAFTVRLEVLFFEHNPFTP